MHHRIIDRLLIENERMESMVQELYTLETRDIQILQTVGVHVRNVSLVCHVAVYSGLICEEEWFN